MPSSGGGSGTPITSPVPGSGFSLFGSPRSLLSLEEFREILGYHPYHFWGLANNTHVPEESAANLVVRKNAWMDADALGRDHIQIAIEAAEDRLREYLGYSVAPHYAVATVPWGRYFDQAVWRRSNPIDPSGRRVSVQLPEGYVQALGVERLTLLATSAVTPSDQDGDGLNDTFTVTAATTETDITKIAVYIAAGDRLDGEAVGPQYRIQPLKIQISGGTVTIRGRYWLLVKPIKYITYDPEAGPLDPVTASNFVTELEVYVRTTDPDGMTVDNAQATLLWESETCGGTGCICGGCSNITYSPENSAHDPAAVGMAAARVGIRNAQAGIVVPGQAAYDSTSGLWYSINWSLYREPDRVTVRYLAGYPLDQNGNMDRKWRTIVARLAMAELGKRIAAADVANRELWHWQFDLARAAGANDEQYALSANDLDNPFGTLRGQVYAWKQVKNLRLLNGLSMAL